MPHFVRRSFALLIPVVLSFGSIAADARAEFVAALGATSQFANALATFDSASPSGASIIGITGVNGTLTSIDYRPANGSLYALSNSGQLYTVSTTTGVAALVSTLSTSLSGSQFSIDFNPTVDRLRVVSNTGQNLRINVDTGAVTVDTPLSAQNVVAASYTNSVPGATSTTLYDLTYNNNVFSLNTQAPPNDGVINPIGSTGITSLSSLVGFDISGSTGVAYVATNTSTGIVGNVSLLSTINLTTGNVSSVAAIDGAGFQVRGLSVQTVPEPASLVMLGLGLAGVGVLARRRAGAIG